MVTMKRKHRKITQVYDGERYLRAPVEVLICCGCGLTHITHVRHMAGKTYETMWVDNRRTANARRGKRYKGLRLPVDKGKTAS